MLTKMRKERISRILWNCEALFYNFIVSIYVEPLKPSNQMSNVKLYRSSVSCEFDVLVVLLVIFLSFSIF
jgi:hypothetical protein